MTKATRIRLGAYWKKLTPELKEKHKSYEAYYNENKETIDKMEEQTKPIEAPVEEAEDNSEEEEE